MTFEIVLNKVSTFTSKLGAPLIKLAFLNGNLIGAAELKFHEMDIYPQYKDWIGGVYVSAEERGHGIGSLLVKEVISEAQKVSVKKLYLQTDNLDGGLYCKFGFKPIEQVNYKGNQVLVMCKLL